MGHSNIDLVKVMKIGGVAKIWAKIDPMGSPSTKSKQMTPLFGHVARKVAFSLQQ